MICSGATARTATNPRQALFSSEGKSCSNCVSSTRRYCFAICVYIYITGVPRTKIDQNGGCMWISSSYSSSPLVTATNRSLLPVQAQARPPLTSFRCLWGTFTAQSCQTSSLHVQTLLSTALVRESRKAWYLHLFESRTWQKWQKTTHTWEILTVLSKAHWRTLLWLKPRLASPPVTFSAGGLRTLRTTSLGMEEKGRGRSG